MSGKTYRFQVLSPLYILFVIPLNAFPLHAVLNFLDFLAGGMVREGIVGFGYVLVDNHAAFLSDGLENKGAASDCDFGSRSTVVPAKLFDEQRTAIDILQMFSDLVSVEGRRHVEGAGFSGCGLQTPNGGQDGHLAVQRQGLQSGTGIVIGDESVEESRAV